MIVPPLEHEFDGGAGSVRPGGERLALVEAVNVGVFVSDGRSVTGRGESFRFVGGVQLLIERNDGGGIIRRERGSGVQLLSRPESVGRRQPHPGRGD